MGRSSERLGHQLRLELKAPSFFRCPISLEVMRSPVSLCTGVTYDRSSIQRWLDSGNTTCPATMLPLPSTDLVPNLTLRRLINIWSSSSSSSSRGKDDYAPAELVQDLKSAADPLPILQRLAQFFADPDIDDSIKTGVTSIAGFANAIVSVMSDRLEAVEAAVDLACLMLTSDWIEERNKEALLAALRADSVVAALAVVLNNGSKSDSIRNSVAVLQAILSALSSEKIDAVIPLLIGLITSSSAIDESLGCLMELLPSKRAVKSMVQFKLVPALVQILSPKSQSVSPKAAERAIMMLEAALNCSAGRAAINEMVEECVEGVTERMMKVGKEGREAAVGLLWGVCFGSGGDRRLKEAVSAVRGGMAKILVVMQGDCSPAARRMAGDLLRVFRADTKSLVAGYDTKTTHIRPF